MPQTKKTTSAVNRHRRLQRQAGLVRVELPLPREDRALLRQVAKALNDPSQADATRSLLRQIGGTKATKDFKQFLVDGPGIPDEYLRYFERPRTRSRDVDLEL